MDKVSSKLLLFGLVILFIQMTTPVAWSAEAGDSTTEEEWYTPAEQPAGILPPVPAEAIDGQTDNPQTITFTAEPIPAESDETSGGWQRLDNQEDSYQAISSVDSDRIAKSNVLAINMLGLVPSEPRVKYNFTLRLETVMADFLSLFLLGNYKQLDIPSYYGEYRKYGGGMGAGLYPFTELSGNTGLWVGPIIRYEQGKYQFSYPGVTGSWTDDQVTYGGEIGYKWLVGEGGWLAINPYIGYYSSSIKYEAGLGVLDEHYTYYNLGLNVGIAF